MSYINEALRKAQRERDGRYERFGAIIAPCAGGPGRPRRRRFAIGAGVALLVLISAGTLLAYYLLSQPPHAGKGIPPPVAVGMPPTLPSAMPQGLSATVPGENGAVQKASPEAVESSGGAVSSAAAPGETPVLREAEARYREALSAQRRGDLKEAEGLYQKVLLLDPAHLGALNNLGVLCMEQKKREWAIALFNRAIVLKRDYVDPYYNLACLYARTRQIDESLRYLKAAMAINGDVKKWVETDADMKNIVASSAFRKIMEGQKN
jgi:tetratricopeptide (TPR) repeat protein